MNLDGKDDIRPVPFDAHEKEVRAPHEHTAAGYKKVGEPPAPTAAKGPEPKHPQASEFPKAIAHDKDTGEPVVAKDAAHEKQLRGRRKVKAKAKGKAKSKAKAGAGGKEVAA